MVVHLLVLWFFFVMQREPFVTCTGEYITGVWTFLTCITGVWMFVTCAGKYITDVWTCVTCTGEYISGVGTFVTCKWNKHVNKTTSEHCNCTFYHSDECIVSSSTNMSLDNLNASSCMTLRRKPEVVPPEVIPQNVNKTCVKNAHVNIARKIFSFLWFNSFPETL